MRKQALLVLLGLLGMCCSAMAADERPVTGEKSPVSRTAVDEVGPSDELPALDDAPGMSGDVTPVLIDPNMVFKRVMMGADGKTTEVTIDDDGGVAGPGERLIYENTLGIYSINFPTNQPVSDDISTVAPDGCNLTRYKFKVLGKVLPTGAGGAYTVTYGLYTNCPLAIGSSNAQRDVVRIPGTEGVIAFPDDAPRDIEHVVPFLTPVALPANVYLGLRFNRGNCGTVVGAPAMTGYSGDLWDYPGFPCNGFLGGFPQLPHASFWLQMYGTTNCSPAFAGYKCQRPSGGTALIGANKQGVDDVELIINNCQMVGYEVAVRGVGFYTFDLRRDCESQIVPGSERTFQISASTTPQLQIARFTFNPPIVLTTDKLFLGFKSSSNSSGVVIAGIDPIIGLNEVDYFVIGEDGCAPVLPTQGVHGAVNLAITCSGVQPLGACCDPHLTQCNAGPDLGKRCPCDRLCSGGPENGVCCVQDSDCDAPGTCQPYCAGEGTCEAVCRESTELNCPFPPKGADQRPTWQEGEVCVPDPFLPDACGVAACCHLKPNPQNPNILDEVCENLTKNQCNYAIPLDKARLWQLGQYCGLDGQTCPRNACLARDGSCYVTHNTPGCSDPFCCERICAFGGVTGAFCCNTAWDSACVALAETLCSQAPDNDQCAPDFPVRGPDGALAIPYPGSKATSNLQATEPTSDPGFCCHNGVGVCQDPSGPFENVPCIVDQDCGGATCSERFPDPGAAALGTIWFKFVPTGTSAGISTCTSNSPALDSIIQVFKPNDLTDAFTECNSLSVIGCNDDAANCSSTQRNSRVCLQNLTPGATYYILLGSKTENRRGQYIVSISTSCNIATADSRPVNDYCNRATAITDATPADPLVVPFTLGRACSAGANIGKPCTVAGDCPGGTCSGLGASFECPSEACSTAAQNDIWYNYTATCTGDATFSTCGGSSPNTNLAVYDGCTTCPSTSNNNSAIGCNEDSGTSGCVEPARVTAPVIQGQCYKVRLSDQDGFPVSGNLTITCSSGDCNNNGVQDAVEIANCPPSGNNGCKDCNGNGKPDVCDIPPDNDCQPNGIPDLCELAGNDCQPDGIPDDCGGTTGGLCPTTGQCSGFVSSVPTDCNVDARRPHPQNAPGTLEGRNSLTMTFGAACDAAPADFTVTCSPTAAPCPTISDVSGAGVTQTITLSSVIPAGNWTCVKHTATGAEVCLGSLPGDADGGGTTAPADILRIIDNLNLQGVPLTLDHCDLDRSGLCNAADIIALIDMLNGNGYIVWNAKSLPVCP